jgi:tRNA A-37 threonylcarbamoyl transferase component Bud32
MRSLIQTIATMIPHNTIQAIQWFKNKVLTLWDQEGQDAYPFMMTNIIHNAYINISNLTTAHWTKMQLFTLEEWRIVKELFTKVLDLMKQHNFVHWDLNPNNIMCIKSEWPDTKRAIIDFGLSEQHHGNYERDSKFFQDSFHSAWLPKY